MQFKYLVYLETLTNCPPNTCQTRNMNAYRFIFEDVDHQNNFKPVLIIDPKRVLGPDTEPVKCSGYALSFFDSSENARSRYKALTRSHKNIGQKLGSHIAKVQVDVMDGVCSEPNKSGHFDLHEYQETDFRHKILDVERI